MCVLVLYDVCKIDGGPDVLCVYSTYENIQVLLSRYPHVQKGCPKLDFTGQLDPDSSSHTATGSIPPLYLVAQEQACF